MLIGRAIVFLCYTPLKRQRNASCTLIPRLAGSRLVREWCIPDPIAIGLSGDSAQHRIFFYFKEFYVQRRGAVNGLIFLSARFHLKNDI